MIRRPPRSTLFPYNDALPIYKFLEPLPDTFSHFAEKINNYFPTIYDTKYLIENNSSLNTKLKSSTLDEVYTDRKSTRLNSSHSSISYAVFCLKKKNQNITFD